jgi:RHS repeat-associated protein
MTTRGGRAQWDPRIAPALKTTYDFNDDGLLSRVTPPGEQPWAPVNATAIFGPDQGPGSGTPTSYSRATVHDLNGSGREVNTALPGGRISTSEYDEHQSRSPDLRSGVTTMGVRTYVPQLGRFLQPDPVQGGSANDYDYTNQDPVNTVDLDGRCICLLLIPLGEAGVLRRSPQGPPWPGRSRAW